MSQVLFKSSQSLKTKEVPPLISSFDFSIGKSAPCSGTGPRDASAKETAPYSGANQEVLD